MIMSMFVIMFVGLLLILFHLYEFSNFDISSDWEQYLCMVCLFESRLFGHNTERYKLFSYWCQLLVINMELLLLYYIQYLR